MTFVVKGLHLKALTLKDFPAGTKDGTNALKKQQQICINL